MPTRTGARYDEKLVAILRQSAAVFAEKGYEGASIRDIAAVTGASLSGLYYYFKSKEELLFLIQHHCFDTILERVASELRTVKEPGDRLHVLIRTHLRFFVDNMSEMKVLSHEADALSGEYRDRVLEQKRAYSELATEVFRELCPESALDPRTATFSLFGMLNWIYTWYRPGKDIPVDRLAGEMAHIYTKGVSSRDGLPPGPGTDREGPGDSVSIWRDP